MSKVGITGLGYKITPAQRKRFFQKIKRVGECWIWTSNIVPVPEGDGTGYPLFRLDKKTQIYAHRVAWMMFNGDIPLKANVKRTCKKNLCVNPQHLYLWRRESTGKPKITEKDAIVYDPPDWLIEKNKGGESDEDLS